MAVLALTLLVTWLVLVAGFREYLQYRRTGAVPALTRTRPESAQWWAKLVSSVGFIFAFAAPIGELAGLAPIPLLDHAPLRLGGVFLVLVGIAGTLLAQSAMGESWRGDVDHDARTPLVTDGPFRLVRNPILTATSTTERRRELKAPSSAYSDPVGIWGSRSGWGATPLGAPGGATPAAVQPPMRGRGRSASTDGAGPSPLSARR